MMTLETLLSLLGLVVGLAIVADGFRFPLPVLLVITGMVASLLPRLSVPQLTPETVFRVFLPPLLYACAWDFSWRELKDNMRVMAFLVIGLVVTTAAVVAHVLHAVMPTIPLAAGWVLGAVVAPPDAIAASAIIRQNPVPHRVVTVLEGESLLNDATALVLFGFAVAAVVTGQFSMGQALIQFFFAGLGGVVFGGALAWVSAWVWYRLDHPPAEMTLSILIPFAAYWTAEHFHLSGVLATVTAGLVHGWLSPRMLSSQSRLQGRATWDTLQFILNGLVFLLTGFQLPVVIRELDAYPIGLLVGLSLAICGAVIAVRMLWVFAMAYIPRWLWPSLRQRDPYPDWQSIFLVAWSGLRGVVSLAAAFAIPLTLADGSTFPHRPLLLFLTFCVILVTLVFQGLSLPAVIRWLRLPTHSVAEARHSELRARIRAAEAALAKLEDLIRDARLDPDTDLARRLRYYYEHRLLELERAGLAADAHPGHAAGQDRLSQMDLDPGQETRLLDLELEVLSAERTVVLELRNQGIISASVQRQIERDLDHQEAQLRRREG